MGKKNQRSTLRGRDAGTGQFIKIDEARRRKKTAIVERIPLPGKGKKGK